MIPPPTKLDVSNKYVNGCSEDKVKEINRVTNEYLPKIIPEIAEETGVKCIDLNTPIQNHPKKDEFLYDQIHLTVEGYGVFAQNVYRAANHIL